MSVSPIHRFLSPLHQAITALASTSVKPASAITRTAVARIGNGRISIDGPYTGDDLRSVDVEITAAAGDERATVPVLVGVGTGTMTSITVGNGVAAQDVEVELTDPGSEEVPATIDLGGVDLVAKAAGAAGNDIEIEVDQSGITPSATDYALVATLPSGMERSEEPGASFGGPIGLADEVPVNALRIFFESDPGQIYLHWRSFEAGNQVAHFSPPLRRAYERGDRVYSITGTRTVTVDDGVTPETYPGIVTLSDLLVDIREGSALLDVIGPIDPTRDRANAQGTQDLSLWTTPRLAGSGGTGSRYATLGPANIHVGDDAVTEVVEARCVANSPDQGAGLGFEAWELRGSVSGDLGIYRTGDTITGQGDSFAFLIPHRLPPDYNEDRAAPIRAQVAIADADSQGAVDVYPLRAGRMATAKTVTFTYRARTEPQCDPRGTPYTPLVGLESLLGFRFVTELEGLALTMASDYRTRLTSLFAWKSAAVAANARTEQWSIDARYRLFRVSARDLDLFEVVTQIFARALKRIYNDATGRAAWDTAFTDVQAELLPFGSSPIEQSYLRADDWNSLQSVGPGQFVKTTRRPGTVWLAQTAGKTGLAQPLDTAAATSVTWAASTAYALNDRAVPTTRNGYVYKVTVAGTSGASEPTWPTVIGNTVVDGGVTWECEEQYWSASTAYAQGDQITPYNGQTYVCTLAGTSGTTEPTWTGEPGDIADGTAKWHFVDVWPSTVGATCYDGSTIWELYEEYWTASNSVALNDEITPWNGLKYKCTQAGTTGTSEPAWSYSTAEFTDGTAKWQRVSGITAGAANSIERQNVEYVSNVWEMAVVSEHTEFQQPLYLPGGIGTQPREVIPPAVIDTVAKTTYVHARVWRIIDGYVTLVYARSWETSSLSGTEITDLKSVATEEVEEFLQRVGNETADMASAADYARKWASRMEHVLATGGIEPDFNAAGSSALEGDSEIWRDVGGSFWWVPEDTDLLPAFSNVEYVSCKRDQDGTIRSTMEFSMAIRVGKCATLADGDTITVILGNAAWAQSYSVGDTMSIRTLAGAPITTTGGADASLIQTWSVSASIDGPLAPYVLDPESPTPYSNGGIGFLISDGGIRYASGDRFLFSTETPSFRYREDGGSWSGNLDVSDTAIADGLTLHFEQGVSPSFAAADSASFEAEQPYKIANALTPEGERHAWSGASVTITAQCTGDVDAILIADHTLPEGATINVSDGGTLNQALTWRPGPIAFLLTTPLSSPTLTFTIGSAATGAIGWIWAGEAKTTQIPHGKLQRRVTHQMIRGGSDNATAGRTGTGNAYSILFDGHMRHAEAEELLAMVEASKAGGDLPVCFIPHNQLPEEAALVRFADNVELADWYQLWNPSTDDRRITAALELTPWISRS